MPALKKLLQAGGIASLRFVFVSACFSEAAAQAFVEAGVPHVIAVRLTTRVSDHAAHAFTRAFYLALAVGQSIKAAFDIGVQSVVNAPNVPAAHIEGDKFLLFGAGNHDAVPFPQLAAIDTWQPPARKGSQHQQPLPPTAEAFLGRNVETYRVVTGVLDRRLVSVTGTAGVGKTAVAIAALNYLAQRHYFSDGVVYVDSSSACDMAALAALLRAQIGRSVAAGAATGATPAVPGNGDVAAAPPPHPRPPP